MSESYIREKIEKEYHLIQNGEGLGRLRLSTPSMRRFVKLFVKQLSKNRSIWDTYSPSQYISKREILSLFGECISVLSTFRTQKDEGLIPTFGCAVAILFHIRVFLPPGTIGRELSESKPHSIAASLFKPNLTLSHKRISRLLDLGLCITSPKFLRGVWTSLTREDAMNPYITDSFRDLVFLALRSGAIIDYGFSVKRCYSPYSPASLFAYTFSGTPAYVMTLSKRLRREYTCVECLHESEDRLVVLMCYTCRGVELTIETDSQYKRSVTLFDLLWCLNKDLFV